MNEAGYTWASIAKAMGLPLTALHQMRKQYAKDEKAKEANKESDTQKRKREGL